MSHTCYFCDELRFSLNREVGLPAESSIVYEDDNVFIAPDIAPLIAGHFLIVSKAHLNSYASANDSIYSSLEKAKNHLRNNVYQNSQVLFLEHGAVVEGTGGATIDHAHLHVAPVNIHPDLDKYIEKSGYFATSKKQLSTREGLVRYFSDLQPYIYYETSYRKWHYPVLGEIPHQFLRWMAADCLSTGRGWNWRDLYKTQESKDLFLQTLALAMKSPKEV